MRVSAAAALLAMAAVTGAGAQSIPPQVLELFPAGEDACYVSSIDADAMQPKQKLAGFYLYRLFDPDPSSENIDPDREAAAALDRTATSSSAQVMARFSDTGHFYDQTVTCDLWHDGGQRIGCYVECDGGSFIARKTASGLDVAIEPDGGLSLNQSCGEPDEIGRDRWLSSQDAGGAFSMNRAEPSACAAIRQEARIHDGGDAVPLRQRIADDGWRCLKRSYDKAHLAGHPQQKVTSIAVAIRGPAKAEADADGGYPATTLAVALSFRLRDGTITARDGSCWADDTAFNCEGAFRLRRKDANGAWLLAGEYDDPANPPIVLDKALGKDDRLFRLDASKDADCKAD